MSIAADDGERLGKDRPWARYQDEEKDGAYADWAAWRRWVDLACEAMASVPVDVGGGLMVQGFDPSCPREGLECDAEIGLYLLMCKLADGDRVAAPSPEEALH